MEIEIPLIYTSQEQPDIEVFDSNGRRLILKKYSSNITNVDLSSYPDGLYILWLKIGQRISKWKIIKN